jgi:hypothetical protein
MKTDALVAELSRDLKPTSRGAVSGWLAAGLAAGAAVSAVILMTWLGLRPLAPALASAAFWMKAAYALALTLAGWLMTLRLARPEGRAGAAPWLAVAALGVLGLTGAGQLLAADPGDHLRLLLGSSWNACPWRILALAIPIQAVLIAIMRRMAPTRLGLAGAATGLLAGGAAAAVYGLYCQETSAAFVAAWYSLGVALSVVVGGIAAQRLLRW